MNSLVSVIVPMYNAEAFIRQTIESVMNQTYQDFELIVMNDGSTDHSEAIVLEMQRHDERIKYQYKANSGVSDTRNQGLKLARGQFVAFLDADDCWKPDNLRKKVEAIQQTGKKWVFSSLEYIDEHNRILDIPLVNFKPFDIANNLLLWEGDVVPGPCSNIVVERDFLGEDIRFDASLSSPADRDICLQLAIKGDPFYLDEQLWQYRLHSKSMTSVNIKVVDEMIRLYKKADELKWFSSPGLRRKALSNVNLILAGICSRFPSQRKRMFGFVAKAFWYSPMNVIRKRMPFMSKK